MKALYRILWFPMLFGACTTAAAEGWASGNVQLLHGSQYELGEDTRSIVTGELAWGWAYGDGFAFVDVTFPEGGDTASYGEIGPRFSFYKMAGHQGVGLVKDVSLALQAEIGEEDYRAYLGGLGLSLDIPGFSFFNLNIYHRDNPDLDGSTYQISPSWHYPFTLGGTRWAIDGFLDYAGSEGVSERNWLFVPQILYDLGAHWGSPDVLSVGIEYSYWHNKFGVEGVNEEVVQAMVKLSW